jgi:hypothetical protein
MLNCGQVSHTPEELVNIIINKGLVFEHRPDDTYETIVARLDYTSDVLILPPGEDQLYEAYGQVLKRRVSGLAREAYESRVGKTTVTKEASKPDFDKQKNAGTRVHLVASQIMDALYNGKGTIEQIKKDAAIGDYAITGRNFVAVQSIVEKLISDIRTVQKSIDPTKEASVRVEAKILDARHDIGGAIDVVAIFSDMTISRYDYKTAHSHPKNYSRGALTDDLLSVPKVNDYELSMNEYGRILKEVYGAKGEREVRLIPIHIRLNSRSEDERKRFNMFEPSFKFIETEPSSSNEFLKPIPVTGETSGYAGIDEWINREWNLYNKLQDNLKNKKLTSNEITIINRKISFIRKAIRNALVDSDLTDLLDMGRFLAKTLEKRMKEPEFLETGKKNPKHLSDIELKDMKDELLIYAEVIDYTNEYSKDLDGVDITISEGIRDDIDKVSSTSLRVAHDARIESNNRILKYVAKEYKDADGNLLPLEELDFFVKTFTRFSEIDHPIFKTAWGMIQTAHHRVREDLRVILEDLDGKTKGVFEYANSAGISRLDAFKMIVDLETGHMVYRVSKELIDRIDAAYSNPDTEEAYAELYSIFDINPDMDYDADYQERHDSYVETQRPRMSKYELQKAVDSFESQFDLRSSPEAWANPQNRKYLIFKPEVEKANYSEGFKKVLSNKALLDYYEMYEKYNNQFREIMGLKYRDLPPNFLAQIRKTMVDHLNMDQFSLAAATQELFDSLQLRDEDKHIAMMDASGDIKRSIPKYFLNPFLNKDGEIDNTRKSYDLSKNLVLFAKMALNYKYMSEIEPKILMLREIMAKPTFDQGGTLVEDIFGKKVAGKMKKYATKQGLNSDTYKVLELLTDAYVYGIKFRDKDLGGKTINATKLILKLKGYYGKTTLGLAVIPGIGAYIASGVASRFEGKKYQSYEPEHMRKADLDMVTKFKDYKAFSLFFEPYARDAPDLWAETRSANFISKMATSTNLMYPLIKSDENRTDKITNSMGYNWGLTPAGDLIRMNRRGHSVPEGTKPLKDLYTLNKETGKVEIKGMNEKAYLAFREAVKSTCGNIFGSLDPNDLMLTDVILSYNVMMQYKNWMPGIVRERTGKLIFDDKLQAARWGRFRAGFAEFGIKGTDLEDAFKLKEYITQILIPNTMKLTLDLLTFGISPRMAVNLPLIGRTGELYTDPVTGKSFKVRTNIARAKRMYIKYINEHENLRDKMTFDDFLEVKEGQMKAMLVEMRAIMLFFAVVGFLGGSGGDDKKPRYAANWFTRFMYKNITKAKSELTFMWNPLEFINIIRNPVPLSGLLIKAVKTLGNAADESRDVLFGENSPNDMTPPGFYFLQYIYGAQQIARLVELYKQYEQSPYANVVVR